MKIFDFQRYPNMSAKRLLPLMLALSSIHKGKKCEFCPSLVWLHVGEGLWVCAFVS